MNYSHANFACGVTKLKLLTLSEWVGVVLTISLIVLSVKGFNLFAKVIIHHGNTMECKIVKVMISKKMLPMIVMMTVMTRMERTVMT